MNRQKLTWALTSALTVAMLVGCGKKLPPQNLPAHFEGTMVIDASNVENFEIDWTQKDADLTGHFEVNKLKGEVTASTAGNVIDATLHLSPEDQKNTGFPAELKCTLTIGTVNAAEVRRRYALDDPSSGIKAPDYLKPGAPDLMQLGGFLDIPAGDRKLHRIVTLTNSTVLQDLFKKKP